MLIELSEENKKIIGQLETAVEKLNVYYQKTNELEKLLQFKAACQKKYNFFIKGWGKFIFYLICVYLLGNVFGFVPSLLGKLFLPAVLIITIVLYVKDPIYKKLLKYYNKNLERLEEQIKKADAKFERLKNELITAKEEANYIYTLLPEKYANTYAANKLIEYLKTFRADSLKEAIKLYETEESEKNAEAARNKAAKDATAKKALAGVAVFSVFAIFKMMDMATGRRY